LTHPLLTGSQHIRLAAVAGQLQSLDDTRAPVIWEREGEGVLRYVLDYYEKLVAFYKLAAQRGQAVIFTIS